jgi:Fe-S oxidoreductase
MRSIGRVSKHVCPYDSRIMDIREIANLDLTTIQSKVKKHQPRPHTNRLKTKNPRIAGVFLFKKVELTSSRRRGVC